MSDRKVIWSPAVMEKLTLFRSNKFTPEETLDYISQFILNTEDILENDIIGKSYTEEFGKYKGISRIVIKKFRVYYTFIGKDVIVLAVLFPGET